jgi:hypothetical protein
MNKKNIKKKSLKNRPKSIQKIENSIIKQFNIKKKLKKKLRKNNEKKIIVIKLS